MTNSLLITKYIRQILSADTALTALLPIARIFPIDAKIGTTFPFAVIERSGIQSTRTKDGRYEDVVTVRIKVVSDKYADSIDIANRIRHQLEGHRYKDDDITISQTTLVGSSETIYNNAFIQTLDFQLIIN